jgi:hypothetical protein
MYTLAKSIGAVPVPTTKRREQWLEQKKEVGMQR